jgi:hypothetical protein
MGACLIQWTLCTIEIRMIKALYIGIIMLLLIYAKESGNYWVILATAALVIAGAFIIRVANKKKEGKAVFEVVDKKKSWEALSGTIILYLCIFGYSLYLLPADVRPYFYVLTFSYIIAFPLTESYKVKYLLYEAGLSYKNTIMPYHKILQIREEKGDIIIDTTKYINHIKIKKDLVSDEFMAYLMNKIKNSAQQQNKASAQPA